MAAKWDDVLITDALDLTWEAFKEKHPGFTSFDGWRRKRWDVEQGRTDDPRKPKADAWVIYSSAEGAAIEGVLSSIDGVMTKAGALVLLDGDAAPFAEDAEALLAATKEFEDITGAPQPSDVGHERLADYEVKAEGDIFINRLTRTIVTNLGEFGTVVFSFERHAQMRRRYADEWERSRETIPEIARDFDLPAKAFDRYKTVHGWTHASDPFTDEEWNDGLRVEDAVEQTLESHRRRFHKQLQQEKWKRVIDDADKWRRFEETALGPLTAAIEEHAPIYRPPLLNLKSTRPVFDVVLNVPDLHYGKSGWAGEGSEGYSREQAKSLLLSRTEHILRMLALYGQPERIFTAVGSDWFHIDNDQGTTTSGTPQDRDGSPHAILWEGSELAVAQLDMVRQVAPIEVFYVAGNHDRMFGWSLLHSVYAWFRNASDVTVYQNAAPRQYAISGETLLGFAHGDGPKAKDLPLLMASEARHQWGATAHRAWFTGHLHYELTRDTMGVVSYQLPALSGGDRWHTNNGYVGSRRALAAYIVDRREGVVATVMAPVTGGR